MNDCLGKRKASIFLFSKVLLGLAGICVLLAVFKQPPFLAQNRNSQHTNAWMQSWKYVCSCQEWGNYGQVQDKDGNVWPVPQGPLCRKCMQVAMGFPLMSVQVALT